MDLDTPTQPPLQTEPGATGLAADFAHAIGLDQAVRMAMELPPLAHPSAADAEQAPSSPAIEAIKARLAARGLLATRPQILVPHEPRADGFATHATTFVHAEDVDPFAELDEWDVAPGREETEVRCRQCRDVYLRPLESTRFACPSCERAWRWAVCTGCDALAFTLERQESWRCGCGAFNRSWWRTTTAMRDAIDVVARRKHEAIEAERRRIREGMRRRRWKLIALAVWAAVAALALPIGVRLAQSEGGGTRETCAQWMRLRPAITNGTIVGDALDAEIKSLSTKAASADPVILEAATDLAASRVGSTAFLAARAQLSEAYERR
jgi:hypothetical protein